jgi:O-antigen/teichoic acid export membrane protein
MQLEAIYKLLGGSALIFLCRLTGAISVFLSQLLLARWIGATELGIYVLAFSWCLLLSTVSGLGFPAASLRFIGENLNHNNLGIINGYIGFSRKVVLISSSSTALIAILLLTITSDLIPANYSPSLIIALLCIPILTLLRLHDKIAHAFSWFALAFVPSMAVRPCLFLLLIYLASLTSSELTADRTMMLQLFAVLIVMLVQYIAMRSKLSHVMDATPKTQGNKIWTRTAIPLLVTTLFVQYFPELSVVLLGMLLPAKDVAIFYTCFRIALFIGFGIAAINALLTPNISRLYSGSEIKKLQHEVSRTTLVKFGGSVLALFILIFFGDTVLGWFGEDFIEGYPTLLQVSRCSFLQQDLWICHSI